MSRIITLVGIIALLTATAVVAQEPPRPPQEPPQRQQEQGKQKAEQTFSGEIASVDEDAKTVTVRKSGPAAAPTPSPSAERPSAGAAGAGDAKTFHVNAQTDITTRAAGMQQGQMPPGQERPGMAAAGKETLELKDLKEGDRVTVKYSEEGGKNVAKSIELSSHKPTS